MRHTSIHRNHALLIGASHTPTDLRLWWLVLIFFLWKRNMDITSILMMDTCKWTSFAWCVTDGLRKEEDLSDDQKLRRIKSLPPFREYFGYIFFFAGCIAGVYHIYLYLACIRFLWIWWIHGPKGCLYCSSIKDVHRVGDSQITQEWCDS